MPGLLLEVNPNPTWDTFSLVILTVTFAVVAPVCFTYITYVWPKVDGVISPTRVLIEKFWFKLACKSAGCGVCVIVIVVVSEVPLVVDSSTKVPVTLLLLLFAVFVIVIVVVPFPVKLSLLFAENLKPEYVEFVIVPSQAKFVVRVIVKEPDE